MDILNNSDFRNFLFDQSVDISIYNFIIGLFSSLILAYLVKQTYLKTGRSLNDKEYFSDVFIPLALITTLIITVIKFSLALSLGLVGALSIVRFRAAIKEPEELVYLFFIISIGITNGANQYYLAFISTIIICLFLFYRNFRISKNTKNYEFNHEANILSISINDKNNDDVNLITEKLKNQFSYLKLKSADINDKKANYIFWYSLKDKQLNEFLSKIKNLSTENVQISIYSRSGAFE